MNMFDFIKNRLTTLIGIGTVSSLSIIDTFKTVENGVKIVASITISIGAIIHLFIQIKNELKKKKIYKDLSNYNT
jgi:hypothetical protein